MNLHQDFNMVKYVLDALIRYNNRGKEKYILKKDHVTIQLAFFFEKLSHNWVRQWCLNVWNFLVIQRIKKKERKKERKKRKEKRIKGRKENKHTICK